MVAMETVRKISKFFTFVFITQYKLKMGKVSEKSIFSISKPYCEVSDFLMECLLNVFAWILSTGANVHHCNGKISAV